MLEWETDHTEFPTNVLKSVLLPLLMKMKIASLAETVTIKTGTGGIKRRCPRYKVYVIEILFKVPVRW